MDALLQFAIRALGGGIEVVWATPMTESFGLVLGLVLLRRFWGTWIDAWRIGLGHIEWKKIPLKGRRTDHGDFEEDTKNRK